MDTALLTHADFWENPAPFAPGGFPGTIPDLPELRGHVLFETSGSTGAPKWVALSKTALLTSARAVNSHLGVTSDSTWGLALPVHHVGGFGVAARAFAAGCRFAEFPNRWDPSAFTRWLGDSVVTHTSLVPTQVHDLVAAKLRAPSSPRAIVVGGGRLDGETGRAARSLGWPVLSSYGMTEAASQIATQELSSLASPYQPAPLPLLPVWKANVTPDGKLLIHGPALFSGVMVRKNGSWCFTARVSDWHETDDRALVENDRLTPLGRADLRVKVLGELVDLELVERDLSAHGLAAGTFVVAAVPDPRSEHVLVPVFDPSIDPKSADMALANYNRLAPGYRRLRQPVWLDRFPRSPLGKPLRREIIRLIAPRDPME